MYDFFLPITVLCFGRALQAVLIGEERWCEGMQNGKVRKHGSDGLHDVRCMIPPRCPSGSTIFPMDGTLWYTEDRILGPTQRKKGMEHGGCGGSDTCKCAADLPGVLS